MIVCSIFLILIFFLCSSFAIVAFLLPLLCSVSWANAPFVSDLLSRRSFDSRTLAFLSSLQLARQGTPRRSTTRRPHRPGETPRRVPREAAYTPHEDVPPCLPLPRSNIHERQAPHDAPHDPKEQSHVCPPTSLRSQTLSLTPRGTAGPSRCSPGRRPRASRSRHSPPPAQFTGQ